MVLALEFTFVADQRTWAAKSFNILSEGVQNFIAS